MNYSSRHAAEHIEGGSCGPLLCWPVPFPLGITRTMAASRVLRFAVALVTRVAASGQARFFACCNFRSSRLLAGRSSGVAVRFTDQARCV